MWDFDRMKKKMWVTGVVMLFSLFLSRSLPLLCKFQGGLLFLAAQLLYVSYIYDVIMEALA